MALTKSRVDSYIEGLLNDARIDLEDVVKGNVLYFKGDFVVLGFVDSLIRQQVEKIKKRPNRRLVVLLETEGGELGVVERVNQIFRHHFKEVWFIVPSHAYSAGTVLVMSGNKIWMDYYGVLGPTDMQVQRDGELVPAVGYLSSYDRLIEKSHSKVGISPAELEILLGFDQAQLYDLRNGQLHADKVIAEWLVEYKFADWKVHASSGKEVTLECKQARAAKIAKRLSDPELWRSHGRGIPISVIREELYLKVDDFGKKGRMNKCIRHYYDLIQDHCQKLGSILSIHATEELITLYGGKT